GELGTLSGLSLLRQGIAERGSVVVGGALPAGGPARVRSRGEPGERMQCLGGAHRSLLGAGSAAGSLSTRLSQKSGHPPVEGTPRRRPAHRGPQISIPTHEETHRAAARWVLRVQKSVWK